MYFVYRLRCLVDGKTFYSFQESDDPYWCTPGRRLSEIHEDKLNRRMHLPTAVREDLAKYGPQNFWIEAIQGAPTQQHASQLIEKIVTPEMRTDPQFYHRPLGRRRKSQD